MADLSDRTHDVNIANDGNTKRVTVTTDGAKERLDVDARLDRYVPVVSFTITPVLLAASPTWTVIASHTGTGKVGFIAVSSSNANYRVRLVVDSVVVFNLIMSDLSTLGLTSANSIIWTESADKNFRYRPTEAPDFTTSFSLEAQLVSGSPEVTHLVHYRTRV